MATNRQVKIFINGKEIENQIKSITAEKRKMNAELDEMVRGTDAYIKKAAEIRKVNGILEEHQRGLKPIAQGYNLLSTGGLTKLGALAAGAFSADVILSYGKHLFDLSGQMELLEQRARTVFGEVFPQVTAAAEKNAAAIGLTESQYINAATAIGDFLVPMQFTRQESADMATQLVNLSGALAEWEGGTRSAVEVSQILSKALLGEREELKQLGIALSEEDVQNRLREKGLKGLTGEYAKQAEAIATIEIITESSADAITAFANSSETLARKQAALRAEITNISEKLSATLYPVFERLVGIAGSVVTGLGSIADGFTSLINPAKSSSAAFDDQATKVKKLEAELPPLLDRYEELQGKSNLTQKEQKELAKVIQDIGILTPTAITQIDDYGKALGISASASREFLQAEKARLLVVNDQAITDNFRAAVRIKEQRDKLKKEIESGVKELTTVTLGGTTTQLLSLSAEEISTKSAELEKLTLKLTGYRAELKRLKGEPLTPLAPELPAAPNREGILRNAAGAPTEKELKAAEKKREKEKADVEKHQSNIQKILDKYRKENFANALDEEERKIELIRQEYNKEIDEIKLLEEQKIKGATEAILELEKQKEIAINLQREEFRKEREAKDLEDLEKQTEAEVNAAAERISKGLEERQNAKNIFNEFTLSEFDQEVLQLQTQYNELLALADKYGLDKVAIEKAYNDKLAKLREENQQKVLTETEKDILEVIGKVQKSLSTVTSIATSYSDVFKQLGLENTAFAKSLALVQILSSQASAIGSAVASAIQLPFPANLAAIGTAIGAVVTAISQAKAVLKEADTAQAAVVAQRYTGGFFDVQGQQDGRSYNAQFIGSPGTGLLPNRPVLLASERGQEYLVSNPDLQNPKVLNYVRAIENIRQSRTGGGVAVQQFAEGGFPPGPGGGDAAQLAPLVVQVLAVLQAMNGQLESGIDVRMGDDGVLGIVNRYRTLNKASGGVL